MEIVTKENINSILLAGENIKVEFKSSFSNTRRDILLKTISSFANTEGGVIILGYNERTQIVIGTSANDFEIVKDIISPSELEQVCSAYTVQYKKKTLIIIQVEKSASPIIAGGGAYIRNEDGHIFTLKSKDMLARITSPIAPSEFTTSSEILERLETKTEQIYNEMLHSQQAHEKELKEQEEKHKQEIKDAKGSNWFFCILSAIIGWVLGLIPNLLKQIL